jgi:hypothetical protein
MARHRVEAGDWHDVRRVEASTATVSAFMVAFLADSPAACQPDEHAALVEHRGRQAAEHGQQGASGRSRAWSSQHRRWSTGPHNLRERSFFPLLAQAGLPRIHVRDLRHSCATLLLSEGVHPKIVSDLLGHSQIGSTLDLHSQATMQAVAAEAMGRLLGGQADSQATDDGQGQAP